MSYRTVADRTGPSMIIDRLRLVREGDHIAIYEDEALIRNAPDWTSALAFVDGYHFEVQREEMLANREETDDING